MNLADVTEDMERLPCRRCGSTKLDDGHGGAKCYNPGCSSTRIFIASNHDLYRQNRYRFYNGCWEFDDGVGPWTPSAMIGGKSQAAGEAALLAMNYILEVPSPTSLEVS